MHVQLYWLSGFVSLFHYYLPHKTAKQHGLPRILPPGQWDTSTILCCCVLQPSTVANRTLIIIYKRVCERYVYSLTLRRVFPMYSSEKTSNLEEKKKLATTSVSSKSRMQMANPLARLISHAKVKGMARMVSIYTSTSQHKHLYSCICRIYLS